MKIKPRKNFVLVKVEPSMLPGERITKGGIVVPITVNEAVAITYAIGMIESIGPEVTNLEVGKKVLLNKHAGNQIKDIETEINYVLIEENQIAATVG